MKSRVLRRLLVLIIITGVTLSLQSCSVLRPVGKHYGDFTGYYNTYYFIKRNFSLAERKTRKAQIYSRSGESASTAVPTTEYQAVLDGGAKLLEFHPSSRWIDDTLLMMGIAYFRLEEYARSERKFSELVTIFPGSEHAPLAGAWRARTYAAQKKEDAALNEFLTALPRLQKRRDQAFAHLHLADLYARRKQWSDAAEHYESAARTSRYRSDQSRAWFQLGIARYQQRSYPEAMLAFRQTVHRTRNLELAYDSYVYSSRCALALQQYEDAERILLDLKRNPVFRDLIADIDLDLAELAIRTDRVDDGIELYQNYINTHENSSTRARAYLELGYVYRDLVRDLPAAKAKFDSAGGAGGGRGTIDSANVASEGLSRGLLSLERVVDLQDSIWIAVAEIDSLAGIDWSNPPTVSAPDSGERVLPDSAIIDDTTAIETPVDTGEFIESADTTRHASRAALLADSLLKLMTEKTDSARGLVSESDSMESAIAVEPVDTLSGPEREALLRIERLETQIGMQREQLQGLYLQIAEFYEHTLDEPDSTLAYLRRSIAVPVRSEDRWKALLQLANLLEAKEGRTEEVSGLLEEVLLSEHVSPQAANLVRRKLGYAEVWEDVPEDVAAFNRAEAAYFGDAELDTAIHLYNAVIAMDSSSATSLQALFALQYIYEFRLSDFESAQGVTEAIVDLHPDSGFTERQRLKLTPPPSGSVFDMTDEQMAEAAQSRRRALSVEPDSTGWPPPEDELRGRRYR